MGNNFSPCEQPADKLAVGAPRLLTCPWPLLWKHLGGLAARQEASWVFPPLIQDYIFSFLSCLGFLQRQNSRVIVRMCTSISFHVISEFPPEPTIIRKHINALSKFTTINYKENFSPSEKLVLTHSSWYNFTVFASNNQIRLLESVLINHFLLEIFLYQEMKIPLKISPKL